MKTLETLIADWREQASSCRRVKDERIAEVIEQIIDDMARGAEPFMTWIPESDAIIRSGHGTEWFRARYAMWERQGLARVSPTNKRHRQYLLCIVPVAVNLDAVRADARRAALEPAS